jgi:hypothetical protein
MRGRLAMSGCVAAVLALFAAAPAMAQSAGGQPPAGAEGPVAPVADSSAAPGNSTTPDSTVAPASDASIGPSHPALLWSASLGLAEGYSTNAAGGTAPPDNRSDFFTQATLGLGVQYQGRRLNASGAYQLTGDYYTRVHDLDRVENRLSVAAESELLTDMLFLRGQAFAAPIALSRVGTLSSRGSAISDLNSRDSYGYSVEPTFQLHLEDLLVSTLTASEGGLFFVQPSSSNPGDPAPLLPAENSISTSVSEQIASGTYFDRLAWSATGSYSQNNQTIQTERQTSAFGNVSYAVTRWLAILGTGGYNEFKSSVPLVKQLSGWAGMGGIRVTEGETLVLTVEGGTQYNFPSYIGSLNWKITPRTSLVASVTDTVTTPQGSILSNLATFATTPQGGLGGAMSPYTPPGGDLTAPQLQTISPVQSYGLSLDNSIYRQRDGNLALVHGTDRNDYTLSVYGSERDQLTLPIVLTSPRTSIYGASLGVSRRMRPDLTGGVSVGYSFASEFGGHDRILSLNAGLSYQLSQKISVYMNGYYLDRSGSGVIGVPHLGLSDGEVMIGIQAGL